MVTYKSSNIEITGVCCAVPGKPISINEIESPFTEKEVKRFSKMVGVNQLYRASEDQTTLDLCIIAAKKLMNDLNWVPDEIDGLIFVSQTPDYVLPASSAIAQEALGLNNDCFCFDVNMGCSGYVYGLQIASRMLQKNQCEKILLLVGDTISKIISPEDKSVALLFGDAGSATAASYKESASESIFVLGTDGKGAKNLIVSAGAFKNQDTSAESYERVADDSGNKRSAHDLYMNGSEVFNFTISEVPKLVDGIIESSGVDKTAVDYFVLHQANKFMLEQISRKIGVDLSKVPINIEKYGNTSSATIPLVLIDNQIAENNHIINKKILMAGFGVGFSWGAAIINFENTFVSDLVYC